MILDCKNFAKLVQKIPEYESLFPLMCVSLSYITMYIGHI